MIEKRFKAVNVPCTEETRREYREMLFTTSGLSAFISGVILFEETLRQKSAAARQGNYTAAAGLGGVVLPAAESAAPSAGQAERIFSGILGLGIGLHRGCRKS